MEIIKEWWESFTWWLSDWWIPTLGCAVIAVLFYFMIDAIGREHEQWEAFKQQHQCKVVSKVDGDTMIGTGVSTSGSVVMTTTSTPDKIGYLCDDGITYFKSY